MFPHCANSYGILPMLRIPNRQKLLPLLFYTELQLWSCALGMAGYGRSE